MPKVYESNYGGLIVDRDKPTEVKGDVINNDTLEKMEEPTVQFKDENGIDQAVGMSWFDDPAKKERLANVIKERYGDKFVPPVIICCIAKELELSDGVKKEPETLDVKPKQVDQSFAEAVGLEFGNWEGPRQSVPSTSEWSSEPEPVKEEDLSDWF